MVVLELPFLEPVSPSSFSSWFCLFLTMSAYSPSSDRLGLCLLLYLLLSLPCVVMTNKYDDDAVEGSFYHFHSFSFSSSPLVVAKEGFWTQIRRFPYKLTSCSYLSLFFYLFLCLSRFFSVSLILSLLPPPHSLYLLGLESFLEYILRFGFLTPSSLIIMDRSWQWSI